MMKMLNDDDYCCFTIPMLPEDVALGIFLRLPVESILRFKCVSKSWYSSLTSPSFIAKHLSIQSNDHLFLHTLHKSETHATACSVSNIDDFNSYTELDMLSSYINHNGCRQWTVTGPCDGLIVISDKEGGDVIVCNIATRNFRTLPRSCFYPFPKNDFRDLVCDPVHAVISYLGIGYDSKTKDYKVLRVLEIWNDSDQDYQLPPKAEVFSIATDTCWKEIDMTSFKEFVNLCSETYLEGTLYCLSADSVGEFILLSFNIVEERFRNITLPTLAQSGDFDWFPGVYDNQLALFVLDYKVEGELVMDVWVMRETETKQSWSKLLAVGPIHLPYINGVIGFWKNDTKLIYYDKNGRPMVYDLVKKESKNIACKDDDWYMKTLVSIKGRE